MLRRSSCAAHFLSCRSIPLVPHISSHVAVFLSRRSVPLSSRVWKRRASAVIGDALSVQPFVPEYTALIIHITEIIIYKCPDSVNRTGRGILPHIIFPLIRRLGRILGKPRRIRGKLLPIQICHKPVFACVNTRCKPGIFNRFAKSLADFCPHFP